MMCLMGSCFARREITPRPVRTPTELEKYLGVSVSPATDDTRGAPVRLTAFDDENLSSANKCSLQPSCTRVIGSN